MTTREQKISGLGLYSPCGASILVNAPDRMDAAARRRLGGWPQGASRLALLRLGSNLW
jgi:hypothetical protein